MTPYDQGREDGRRYGVLAPERYKFGTPPQVEWARGWGDSLYEPKSQELLDNYARFSESPRDWGKAMNYDGSEGPRASVGGVTILTLGGAALVVWALSAVVGWLT